MKKEKKEKTGMSVWSHYKAALGSKLLWGALANACVFALGTFIGNVLTPIYFKGVIDSITTNATQSVVIHFFILIVIASIFHAILIRTYEFFEVRVLSRALVRASSYSLDNLTKHSYQFFANNFAGSLITKSKRFVNSLDQMSDLLVRDFLYSIVSVFGILIILFNTSLPLALMALFWFFVFFAYVIFVTRIRIPLERARSEMESKVTGVLSDIITNVLNLKIFSSRKTEQKYFDNVLEEEHRVRRKAWGYANKAYTIQSFISVFAKASLIGLSIWLWSKGNTTSGTIVLVITYSTILFDRLAFLGSAIRRFFDAYVNAQEYTELLNRPIEIKDISSPETPRMKAGEIIFDNVAFGYHKNNNVIENLNLKINSGEKIGLVGTSGAGKTTITKILLRFADVSGGRVLIDGQDIRNITQDDLRNIISYVPQDPILFHRSLAENIAYGKPNATREEIIDASRKAHAHEFISSLPHGYETLVGERGIKLSGGERQRVAIARAILKNSPVLILDEATSSLDSVSEMHIKAALDELMKGKTTLVIAHRLSTIEKMDRILVLEKGQIIEEGNHKELLSKKGVYHNFWNHQNGGFIE